MWMLVKEWTQIERSQTQCEAHALLIRQATKRKTAQGYSLTPISHPL